MRLDINYKKKNCKKHKHMEIKQHISKWPTGYWRNKKGNQEFLETNYNENKTTQNQWDVANAVLRGNFYINKILPQETRKTLNRQPNSTFKTIGKRRTKKKNPN